MRNKEQHIIDTWHQNAGAWTKAVRREEIASRTLVTNQAMIDTVLRYAPPAALDAGCGEGWLSHALSRKGIRMAGIDAVPELIAKARMGEGSFQVGSYEDLSAAAFEPPFALSAVIFNFSLFGKDSVEKVVKHLPYLLPAEGLLFIQTLHPLVACGAYPYEDGWREGSWAGFGDEFTNPAPWYFRTLQSWVDMLVKTGWQLQEIMEPLHPQTNRPASVIFVCSLVS